jgi:hypothetical protein
MNYFDKALAGFEEQTLPYRAYITIDDDIASLFSDFIEQGKHTSSGSSHEQTFKVSLLTSGKLDQLCRYTPGIIHDPFLAIEGTHFNKLFHLN